MTTALEHIRYSCGIAGEEVANYVDELERVVSSDSSLIDELRAQLAAAVLKATKSLEDSLAVVKKDRADLYMETLTLRDKLAKAEQRVAELIPGNGKELSERMKRLATNSVWRYSADQNKPVDMSDPNIQELFAIIDHLCIGLDSPANGASS